MARNRIIYQSEALYVSDDASSVASAKHEQLERVQSANYSFSISRQDINQFGALSRVDSLVLEAPTVSLDFSYYLTNGFNEKALGFGTGSAFDVGFASGHMTATSGKNFYILTTAEGKDAVDAASDATKSVIGIGNAYLTDYTLDLSVGSIPTVSCTMEGANIRSQTDVNAARSNINSPAILQSDGTDIGVTATLPAATTGTATSITALRPGDVTIKFEGAVNDISDAEDGPFVNLDLDGANGVHVQSASLSLGMSRTPLERLGTRFPFARTVDFPVQASLSVSAIVNETTAANLVDIIDQQKAVQVDLEIKKPGTTDVAAAYRLKGARLDSESFSSSIGANKTVDLTFTTQIGGPEDTANNILMSGSSTVHPFA